MEGPRLRRDRVPEAHDGTSETEAPDLRAHLSTILESWFLILKVALVVALGGVAYFFLKTPIYQSDVMIQVEDKVKGIPGLEAFSDMVATQNPAETEIELLRSRYLLGAVVDELGLNVQAEPRYFPIIGRAVARRRKAPSPAPAVFGREAYAWGGERISVKSLEVPDEWLGESLVLVAKTAGRYDLHGPDGQLVATGVVGEPSVVAPGAAETASIVVSELRARPGCEFRVERDVPLVAIEDLLDRITVVERGKKTGILQMSLDGEDPKATARVLDTASRVYVRQNIARKSAEAQSQLEFIEGQLPELKARLETAEFALNSYRTQAGSLDVSIEAKAALESSAEVEKELRLLRLQLDEARSRFTDDHPAIASLKERVQRLERQRGGLETHFRTLPAAELESTRLLRDVKVASELYVLLLNRSQELKVMKSGTIGTVRVVDTASVAVKPVAPKLNRTIIVSVVVGLVIGVGATFARKAMDVGVYDAEDLEQRLQLPVYASVPHSEVQQVRALKAIRRGRGPAARPILAASHPQDLAVEAVRSMRTSLQFALLEAENNVVAIVGPSPGIGKSFVAVNLAAVLARPERRVLLIDTDLRKGRMHEHFGDARRGEGLAEVVATRDDPGRVVRETGINNLHFISTGTLPPNPSDLLESAHYLQVITWASRSYDIVVLDTAPVLAVTDGALAARPAGTTLLILRAGQHPLREVVATVRRLFQTKVLVSALILNDVKPRGGYASAKYGYHYQYEYR